MFVQRGSPPAHCGYAAEFAIPPAALDQAQDGPWKTVRLGIGVEDLDGTSKNHVKWQPKWDWTDTAVPGIGTFARQ